MSLPVLVGMRVHPQKQEGFRLATLLLDMYVAVGPEGRERSLALPS